jgi:hypothetical protein
LTYLEEPIGVRTLLSQKPLDRTLINADASHSLIKQKANIFSPPRSQRAPRKSISKEICFDDALCGLCVLCGKLVLNLIDLKVMEPPR